MIFHENDITSFIYFILVQMAARQLAMIQTKLHKWQRAFITSRQSSLRENVLMYML